YRSLLVAWRKNAFSQSSSDIPSPLSITFIRLRPASTISILIHELLASMLFSTSSLTTEAGRSTTSPAAILFASVSGILRMDTSKQSFLLFFSLFLQAIQCIHSIQRSHGKQVHLL